MSIGNLIHAWGHDAVNELFKQIGLKSTDTQFEFHLKKPPGYGGSVYGDSVQGECQVGYLIGGRRDRFYGPKDISQIIIHANPQSYKKYNSCPIRGCNELRNGLAFVVAHELQHAKQYLTETLLEHGTRKLRKWKGKVYLSTELPLTPWEIEADAVAVRVSNHLVKGGWVDDERGRDEARGEFIRPPEADPAKIAALIAANKKYLHPVPEHFLEKHQVAA